MNRYKETFATWNKMAKLYEDKFMSLDLYNDTYDFICQSITKENAKILEIGCGPGNITRYLLSKRPDFKILGTDIAPKMIELAQQNNPTANFAVMDARQISEINDRFDGIIAGFCLPYLSPTECAELICTSNQLLANNGFIYLSFVEGNPSDSGFKANNNGDRVYFQYHKLATLQSTLKANGFGDIEVFKVDYKKSDIGTDVHTIVTAYKK